LIGLRHCWRVETPCGSPPRDNQPQQNLPREALLFKHALIRVNVLRAGL